MKNVLNVLLFALLFVTLSAKVSKSAFKSKIESLVKSRTKATFNRYFLRGTWVGRGYRCNNSPTDLLEDIVVSTEGSKIVATKINGDDCVNSGQVTFRLDKHATFETGKGYKCEIQLGNPDKPNHKFSDKCTLTIIDTNNIEIKEWGLKFTRGRIEYPRNFFLGFWIGDGYKCNNKQVKEDVHIHYGVEKWQAVKVKGDECVHGGKVTFEADIQSKWRMSHDWKWNIPCIITLGSPAEPQSVKSDKCNIKIIDDNNFEVGPWGITFTRGRLPLDFYPYDFFKGGWIGSGYTCKNVEGSMEQEIEVVYEQGEFKGIKVQGDDCVKAGSLSFKAVTQDLYKECDGKFWIPCAIVLGTPESPSSSFAHNCNIKIIDPDHFEIPEYKLVFRRKECPATLGI